jgi:hypothetical protein
MSNYVYLKAENLKSEVKAKHKIKVDCKIPRVDVAAQAGYYEPLQSLKNPKGMLYLNVIGADGIINSSDRRRSDVWLQCSGINFSSVFILTDLCSDNEIIGYGNPGDCAYFKPKTVKCADGTTKTKERPNPFYNYRNDGFLFIAKPDFTVIEIIIVQNGKYSILSEARRYASGQMNDALAALRTAARPIFQY